jgi:NAD(P)-dependent dehydrogenase (short-subunit alcohol dehydrogenase family)
MARMAERLSGKVAVITGATGALGSAVVERFLAEGARVHAVYLSDERAEALRERIGQAGKAVLHKADLTDEQAVNALFDEVIAAEGRLDVLANVAGGFAAGSMARSSLAKLEAMLSVNLRTCFLCCRKAAEAMQAGGRIINVAAQAARRPTAKRGCYVAAKSAVLGLTGVLAKELFPKGVTVNAVLPGTIDTPANREAMPDADFSKWTSPEAIAEVFVFLASDAAGAVNGAEVPV